MSEKLTPEQKIAVEHRGSNLLVSAAAGSGKTKVLVDRLMGYLIDPVRPANIDDFLMITYTKAAAAELRGKIAAKLSEKIAEQPENRHLQKQMQRLYLAKISTVHAFCGDVLREYAYQLDISGDFRVADENECREIRRMVLDRVLENAYDQAGDNPDFCAFVDTQGLGRDDRQVQDVVLAVYDSARCHLNPAAWLRRCVELVDTQHLEDASETVFGKFLMDRLFQWLDLQIPAMERCADMAEEAEGLEKPTALLRDTVYQLKHLRESTTWEEITRRKEIDFGNLRFPNKFPDEELKERIKAVRNHCKEGLAKHLKPFADVSGKVLDDLGSCTDAVRGLIDVVDTFGKEYQKAKQSRRVLDFGDLEHKTLDLLLGKNRSGATAVANEIGSRFREVMVDEYQDSNEVQDAIYGALTGKRHNLFIVGDVKQSIYQFRLADPGIFLAKYASYAPADEAVPGQDTKVLLSRNFRSGGGVLAAANDVFRLCMCPEVGGLNYGDGEMLREGIPHTPLGEPETELYCIEVQEETYPEEAAFVAHRIQELLDGSHYVRDGEALRRIRAEDIAILLRSPGSTGFYYQHALEKVGLRCATGGGMDLLKLPEIATLRAILQMIQNPRQDIPLLAAMASPVFGFSADDLAAIRGKNKKCAFYDSLLQYDGEKAADFLKTLTHLRDAVRHNSLMVLLEEILSLTNLEEVYAAMEDGEMRTANLQTFLQYAAQFESGGNRDLGRFLEHLDAMEEKGLITEGERSAPGCITIMSIHKSKGLEFPVVFLCGLSKAFNMESQRAKVLCHKEMGLGLSAVDQEKRISYPTIAKRAIAAQIGMDSISEEMRVLYVAMTRARDRLIMTYASDKLEKELSEIVTRLDMEGPKLLIQEAITFGDWVLMTALTRTEAGALFELGGKPEETSLREPLWSIRVTAAPTLTGCASEEAITSEMPPEVPEQLKQSLSFRYDHLPATISPSKQTATQRKGRMKDQEAAEYSEEPKHIVRAFRKPGFIENKVHGKTYGTAIHAVMQYIDYAACKDEASVKQEIQRLVEQQYITQEQGSLVNPQKIAAFFLTPLGKKICSGKEVIREFKFSILEDGEAYDPALKGEQVLLQGVVDCALVEPDGITVIDFKTDYVTEETMPIILNRYRPQVAAYAEALQRIYELPIKESLLYFFHTDQFCRV